MSLWLPSISCRPPAGGLWAGPSTGSVCSTEQQAGWQPCLPTWPLSASPAAGGRTFQEEVRATREEHRLQYFLFSYNVFSPSITDHFLSWAGVREGSKKKFGSFTSRMSWEIFTSGRGSPVPLWSSRGGQGEAQHSKGRGSG